MPNNSEFAEAVLSGEWVGIREALTWARTRADHLAALASKTGDPKLALAISRWLSEDNHQAWLDPQQAKDKLLLFLRHNKVEATGGTIDPETSLYKDVDVPGFDLSRRPEANALTPFSCRLACVNDRRCAAFTFVAKKRECWLKSGIGRSRPMAGAVTGAKAGMTFIPKIVRLD